MRCWSALLLNEDFRGRRLLGAVLLVPWAIPYVADALMWKWIYNSNYGALNGLLLQIGFIDSYMVWLGDAKKTLPLIAQAFVWKEVPLAAILLLVGLKTIPADLYAAAKVDGANVVQRFFNITLPALSGSFALVIIYEAMMAIRHFDLFFILTEGGPGDASDVVAWRIYVETFRNCRSAPVPQCPTFCRSARSRLLMWSSVLWRGGSDMARRVFLLRCFGRLSGLRAVADRLAGFILPAERARDRFQAAALAPARSDAAEFCSHLCRARPDRHLRHPTRRRPGERRLYPVHRPQSHSGHGKQSHRRCRRRVYSTY